MSAAPEKQPVTPLELARTAIAWRNAKGRPAQTLRSHNDNRWLIGTTINGGVMIMTVWGMMIHEAGEDGSVRYHDRNYKPADLIGLFDEEKS